MSEADSTSAVEYRPIPGYPGYRVGSDGSVWSSFRRVYEKGVRGSRAVIDGPWVELIPFTDLRTDYPRVGLYRDGKCKMFHIHVLVLLAFVGPCPPGMEGRHLDDEPTHNWRSNLAWGTPKQNWEDKRRNGNAPLGERSGNTHLTAEQVLEMRALRSDGWLYKDLAARYGITPTGVMYIVKRKNWRHI